MLACAKWISRPFSPIFRMGLGTRLPFNSFLKKNGGGLISRDYGTRLSCRIYCIVLSKCPWVLASQTPKIWGGRLHGGGCLNVSTISARVPIPAAKLAARMYWINLHHRFARASSRPAWWWRKLYRARNRTNSSLVANLQRLLLVAREFCTAGEEHCKQGYERECAKPWWRMSWRLKHIRTIAAMYVCSVDLLLIHYARI